MNFRRGLMRFSPSTLFSGFALAWRRNSPQTMPVAMATLSDSEPRRSAGQGGMKSFCVTVRATASVIPRPSLPITTMPAGFSSVS